MALTEEQFNRMYRDGYSRAASIFHRAGLNPADVDDCCQDMFERVWRYKHLMTDTYSPLTFYYLMLKYAILKIAPKYKTGQVYCITNSDVIDYLAEHYPDPVDMTEGVDLESLLKELPEEVAEVLQHKLDGATVDELALLRFNKGYGSTKTDAVQKRIRRLLNSPEVQSIIKLYLEGD